MSSNSLIWKSYSKIAAGICSPYTTRTCPPPAEHSSELLVAVLNQSPGHLVKPRKNYRVQLVDGPLYRVSEPAVQQCTFTIQYRRAPVDRTGIFHASIGIFGWCFRLFVTTFIPPDPTTRRLFPLTEVLLAGVVSSVKASLPPQLGSADATSP